MISEEADRLPAAFQGTGVDALLKDKSIVAHLPVGASLDDALVVEAHRDARRIMPVIDDRHEVAADALADLDEAFRLPYEMTQRVFALRQKGEGAVALQSL